MAKKKQNPAQELDPRLVKIGDKLKQIRLDKNLTNYESMAYESEIGRMQYWRIESGKNYTLASLFKVLDYHQISLSEFFSDFTEVHRPKKKDEI